MRLIAVQERGVPTSRAGLATAEIMFATVAAHSAAGGAVPSGAWLVAMAAMVFGASLLVMTRPVRPVAVLGLVAVAQLGLHHAIGWLAGGHDHHTGSSMTVGMALAHLASIVATALVWRAQSRAARFVTWSVRTRVAHLTRRVGALIARPAPARRLLMLQQCVSRRGPPAGTAHVALG